MFLTPTRRALLTALGSTAALPVLSLPGFVAAAGTPDAGGHILVLIELAGGNDGLNTVIPRKDPAYRALRPEIGIARDQLIGIDEDTGVHPALRPLADLWERGEVQIVEGVGYPDPNRSHFRSIEIWNAGLGATGKTVQGWISHAFEQGHARLDGDADGLVLGGEMGPLSGKGRFSALRDPDAFLERVPHLPDADHPVRPKAQRSPLDHVLKTYESAKITGAAVRDKLTASQMRRNGMPETEIGEQLRTVARLLEAGVEVPVLKVEQGSYDTHAAQPYEHTRLLTDLAEAIAGFAALMRQIGLWDRMTIVTYSEFGRTARENASAGTDHGTAAPVLVIGGQVAGGLSGRRPALDALVDGDLAHTTDYRTVYAAILRDLWDLQSDRFSIGGAVDLRLLSKLG